MGMDFVGGGGGAHRMAGGMLSSSDSTSPMPLTHGLGAAFSTDAS